jgi:sirohydrochlorin ferrochelatase
VTTTLLVAAHGTRSAEGLATTRALVATIAATRPAVPVSLCFLDVATPSLASALATVSAPVVVVPLLLSAGYHVQTDIPAVVSGRPGVRVAQHLGPHPLVVAALADRLAEVLTVEPPSTTMLAAIASSRSSARAVVDRAAALLGQRLGRPVGVLPLSADMSAACALLPPPVAVAVYLLAEGGFLSSLRDAVGGRGVVADPIGVHPAVVSLVWARYDASLA